MAGGAASSTAPTNKARDVMPRAIKLRLGLAGDNSPEPVVMPGYYAHPCIIICESHTQLFLGNFESFPDVANLDALMLACRPADVPDRLLRAVPDLN
jgi:hypothetical protein